MTFFGAGIVFVFVFVFVLCADDSLATTFGAGITFGAGTFTKRVANPRGFGSVFRLVFFSSSSSLSSSGFSASSRFGSRVPAGSSPRVRRASPSTVVLASFIDTALNLALLRLFDAVAIPPLSSSPSNNPTPNAASLPRFVPRTTALGLVTKNDTDVVIVVVSFADILRVKKSNSVSAVTLHRRRRHPSRSRGVVRE